MDKIILQDCSFQCKIGVSAEERKKKREILVDVELFLDTQKAGANDNIGDTINYSAVHSLIRNIIEKQSFHLLERVADEISTNVLQQFPVKKIRVRVKKSLLHRNVKYALVEILRSKKK